MKTSAENPLVSIVIATYNGEEFLRKQLDSLLNQSYQHFEIIAVDDGSTDETLNILREYAVKYANFKVVQNETNLGYVKNFEKGFSFAQGDFIAPCDQDDIWLSSKLEILLNNMEDCEIAYCNSAFIDSDDNLTGDSLGDKTNFGDFDSPLMYVVGASAPGHAMLIKKDIVMAAMPFPVLFSHDNWLGFVATFSGKVKFVDQVLVHYRRHDNNVFSTVHKKKKIKETKQQKLEKAQERLQTLYEKCPAHLPEKHILAQLCKSYDGYSLKNNFLRMCLFFQHADKILRFKKHSGLHRKLYCLKTFFKII